MRKFEVGAGLVPARGGTVDSRSHRWVFQKPVPAVVQAFFMSSVPIFPVRDRLHHRPATGAW